MRKWPLFLAALGLAGLTEGQPQNAPRIDDRAVWQPSRQFLSDARAACHQAPSSGLVDCVAGQMKNAGADADSTRLMRELYKDNHEIGFMTSFQRVGPVDIAWITYAWRPDHNYGLLLVNGQPAMVNVEDLKLLDRKTMEHGFEFRDLRNQFPQVDIWPGDRDGKTWPNSQTGPDGGIQFLLSYPLRNGCQTCAHAGFAVFSWNFNRQGKFLGTTFMGMTPPPLE